MKGRPVDAIPSRFELADIERRHEQHVCTNAHFEPGICVHDRDTWPCDVRLLLNALRAKGGSETGMTS